jgi:hypothetical protein
MKHTVTTIYRDSKTGQIISQSTANRKDPSTWERERVYRPSPRKEK